MRVISGSAKGYGLKAPKHLGLRPTPSRVKEAIFSSLAERIASARVLELFAGTGAFSIEALSQGAKTATLIEKDRRALDLIAANLKKTHLQEKARVLRFDVRQAVEILSRGGEKFDLIFADPPYKLSAEGPPPRGKEGKSPPKAREAFSWLAFLLASADLAKLLEPKGVLLIEFFKKEAMTESAHFEFVRDFRFGDTIVAVFRLKPS
jgi:16S rRNA (guanine966-N2)-methyltransferase